MERNLGEVCIAEAGGDHRQLEEDVRSTVQQLEEERAALGCSRGLLETLLLKAREDAVAEAASRKQKQSITITFGNTNRGFQTGIINGGVSGLTFGGN